MSLLEDRVAQIKRANQDDYKKRIDAELAGLLGEETLMLTYRVRWFLWTSERTVHCPDAETLDWVIRNHVV